MKKTTLALPTGAPELAAFASEARVSGRTFACAAKGRTGKENDGDSETGEKSADSGADTPGAAARLLWDPLSFASARALILEAENALGGRLDELVIFADPPRDATGLADASPRDIEAAALAWAAGHAELIREAARRFREQGGGTVLLVINNRADRGPLGAMATGALTGLAESLAAGEGGPSSTWRFMAILNDSDQPDLVARYAAKVLDEPPRDGSRPLRHGGRGLFGAR